MSNRLKLKYFVLKPNGTDIYAKASREAMRTYANVIEDIDPIFHDDLKEWISYEELYNQNQERLESIGDL